MSNGDRIVICFLLGFIIGLLISIKMEIQKGEPMSDLFPNNQYDADIINQPEIEYRTAKYPFRMRHHYIDSTTKEEKTWDSTHCPVCFWNYKVYGVWDSMIDKGTKFCRRCGQKIKWEKQDE